MPDVSFDNLLIVAVIVVDAPLLVGFRPSLRIPAVVLEIVAGVLVGPSILGWVEVDLPVSILALLGLAFLLFLAGLEIEFRRLWADHPVASKGHSTVLLHHPIAGRLDLAYETLSLPDDPEQVLITYSAQPGSPSAAGLRALASWHATTGSRHAADRPEVDE